MAKKHRRSWTVVWEASARPSTGYRAVVAKLESEKAARTVLGFLDALLIWLGPPTLWFEPRYRVLVGRDGTAQQIGVRESFRFETALQQLAEIDGFLALADEAEVRAALGVEF